MERQLSQRQLKEKDQLRKNCEREGDQIVKQLKKVGDRVEELLKPGNLAWGVLGALNYIGDALENVIKEVCDEEEVK